MGLIDLDRALAAELQAISATGRAKQQERVITGVVAGDGVVGPRYLLAGERQGYLRMNSNSYLSLAMHPTLIEAADVATRTCGVGPGAVRFIDGTYRYHVELEQRVAAFVGKPAARIFNSAYTANCGLALTIGSPVTHWIGDELNHNSIIRAMRIAGVARERKGIFRHNDMADLQRCLDEVPADVERVVIIFDGIYSMRGDYAPVDRICRLAGAYHDRFADGVITVVDDSHGIGAYGATGRGSAEFCGCQPDIIVGTFGKAFGVNGGFIAASMTVVEAVRQKADTYIYTNPLSVADCAAATAALDLCDGPEGTKRLMQLRLQTERIRAGLAAQGRELIDGPHPIVVLLVRDTDKTRRLVQGLFEHGILAVGLTFPVVPRGDECLRFQVNAAHTEADIDSVLRILAELS
jgi:glycine C-acetyltransferase